MLSLNDCEKSFTHTIVSLTSPKFCLSFECYMFYSHCLCVNVCKHYSLVLSITWYSCWYVNLQFFLGEVNQFSMECVFLNFTLYRYTENGIFVFPNQLCVCMQTVGKIWGVPNYDGQHMNGSFYKLSITCILIFSFQ